MKKSFFLILISFIFLSSCAHGPIESTKSILGISTRALEEARTNGAYMVFDAELDACYNKTLEALKEIPAKVYMQNKTKGIIVAMGFRNNTFGLKGDNLQNDPLNEIIDTTELGIFFTKLENNKTKIELSSLSSSLLEFASGKIFDKLQSKLKNENDVK
jgi:hypothetical protein